MKTRKKNEKTNKLIVKNKKTDLNASEKKTKQTKSKQDLVEEVDLKIP
jgi:hypothetical protein